MNPKLIVMLLAAVLLGVGYGLLKSANQARAAREEGTTTVDPRRSEVVGLPVEAPEADKDPEVDVASEPSYPGLGFNDPFFQDAESSLRIVFDLSDEKMTEPVAVVNGEPIDYGDLIGECILRYGMDSVVGTVIREYVIVAELGRRAMPIATEPEAVDREVQRFLQEKYRGKTLDQVLSEINFTESYFRFQVMLQSAMEDLYKMDEDDGELPNPFETGSGGPTKERLRKWQKRMDRERELEARIAAGGGLRDINAKRRAELKGKGGPSHPLFMQMWMQQLVENHRIEQDPDKLPAEVFARVDGVEIDLRTVAPRLLLGLTQGQRYAALDKRIERRLLEQSFAKAGVKPNKKRVNKLYRDEKAEFKGSLITWEMYLQWENSNPALYRQDLQTFDCIDQIQGLDFPPEDLKKHFDDNPDVFGHGGRRVSHILLSALDPKSGLPKGVDAFSDARKRAREVERELAEGKEFFGLVMRFSDDKETKKYTTIPKTKTRIAGDLGIVQPRDTKQEPEIVVEAFKLENGNTAGPILTKKGYHFIHVSEVRVPKEADFEEMKPLVERDFLQQRRQTFLASLRDGSQVKLILGGGEDPWAPYQAARGE